jgi:pimeloyl-ACP methyl ester carboxylesterase
MAKELMGKVTIPVLLLWGARDPLLPAPMADVLAGYLKNAKISKIILDDVGHYPPLEVPERYAAILVTFLENVAPEVPAK